MPVWRNAFSSSHDHLHLEAHESFTKPTQHVPSPVPSFVSPRKRARPFNAQIWRKMEERARDLRAASRSFVPRNFYGEEREEGGRICIVTLPSLVAPRGSDARVRVRIRPSQRLPPSLFDMLLCICVLDLTKVARNLTFAQLPLN